MTMVMVLYSAYVLMFYINRGRSVTFSHYGNNRLSPLEIFPSHRSIQSTDPIPMRNIKQNPRINSNSSAATRYCVNSATSTGAKTIIYCKGKCM